jgi:ribonuclease P protein component
MTRDERAGGDGKTAGRLRQVPTLKRRSEFLRVRGGRKTGSAGFLMECRERDGAGGPRFGYTVTKKLGSAVVRNRIRRRLREAVRLAVPAEPARAVDCVLVARHAALDLPFDTLVADVRTAFDTVGRSPGRRSQLKQSSSQEKPR